MLDAPSPSRRQRSIVVFIAVVLISTATGAWFAQKMFHRPVSFSNDIQPILNQNCVQCHGGVRQKNGVSFIFREEALGTGKSGRRTIVPGLARSGGYSGPLVTQHMWGGILLTFTCWLCWVLRARLSQPGPLFGTPLAMAVVLVAWTGYRGGQLSLGADHLTEHMPTGLRHVLGVTRNDTVSSKADPNTFFGARVQPILAARCVSCHGPDKHKANLRLDTYQGVIRGGKDGPVVHAGNPQGSDLFRRVTLPANHDDFMPKGGKKALSSDEVNLIELWIAAGASETLAKDAIEDAPEDSAAPAVA